MRMTPAVLGAIVLVWLGVATPSFAVTPPDDDRRRPVP